MSQRGRKRSVVKKDKGKEKEVVVKTEQPPERMTREEVMFSKFLNFADFVTIECFPDTGLKDIFEGFKEWLDPPSFFGFVQEFLVPNWVGNSLTVAQVKSLMDSVLARLMIEKPEYFTGKYATKGIDSSNLTDTQVDKLYRYAQFWVHLSTQ